MNPAPDVKKRVLLTWLSGLGGGVLGAALGWLLGVAWAEAVPHDPAEPFADLGRLFFAVVLGLVLTPVLTVFGALRAARASRPLLSGIVFVITSGAVIGLLSWGGALLLPSDIGIASGTVIVTATGTLAGAFLTRSFFK